METRNRRGQRTKGEGDREGGGEKERAWRKEKVGGMSLEERESKGNILAAAGSSWSLTMRNMSTLLNLKKALKVYSKSISR